MLLVLGVRVRMSSSREMFTVCLATRKQVNYLCYYGICHVALSFLCLIIHLFIVSRLRFEWLHVSLHVLEFNSTEAPLFKNGMGRDD